MVGRDPKRLRVGVIGLGVGRRHIADWLSHPDVDVVAIADTDARRLKEVGEQHGISARYACAERMLASEGLDVVSICTPNALHKPLTLAAFGAGCHVLCEKPLATSADDAREMLEASKRSGKRLMVNFSYRFGPESQLLKKQVNAGVFGDFYFGRTVWHRRRGIPNLGGWFGSRSIAGGGSLIDLGVHRLDLALWLMGYPKPKWVLGSTYDPIARDLAKKARQPFDVEDMAVAMIRFDNGSTLVVEASWAANIREAEMMETRLMGTKAGLLQRNLDEGYGFDAQMFMEKDDTSYNLRVEAISRHPSSAMHEFADAILTDRPHSATGEEGLMVMEILDAIYASARSGEPVTM